MRADVGEQYGVGPRFRLQKRREADADERRQIAASDLRRLLDGAVLRRQARQFHPLADGLEMPLDIGTRLDGERVLIRFRRRSRSPRLSKISPI